MRYHLVSRCSSRDFEVGESDGDIESDSDSDGDQDHDFLLRSWKGIEDRGKKIIDKPGPKHTGADFRV